MADVTGPISTLQGAVRNVPLGMMCDDHPDSPAVVRVQGETDSFGSEQHDLCAECKARYDAERRALDGGVYLGNCGRCGACQVPMFPWRDYDEGSAGPVYYNCRSCKNQIVGAMNEAAHQELEEGGYYDRYDFDYGPDDLGADEDDVPDDLQSEPAVAWCIRFVGTPWFVSTRDGRRNLEFLVERDARKFLVKHKGKLRGQRIMLQATWAHAG